MIFFFFHEEKQRYSTSVTASHTIGPTVTQTEKHEKKESE